MPRTVSCNDCSLSPICLPLAVAPAQLDQLDQIIQRGRPLKRGEHLFRAADDFNSVYAVRSGALKTYVLSDEGEEQVTGFYLPGEILGMDG
ncbi:MAG TPA: Crp/Fnr family transcriptional regulator, partial [Alcanivorax sp.]|nr:Crp/Fnr family transcriptional regulator [Alcanivorax sp.]